MVTQTILWLDPDFREPADRNSRLLVALLIAAAVHAVLIFSLRFDVSDLGALDLPLTFDVTLRRPAPGNVEPADVVDVPAAPPGETAQALPPPPEQARPDASGAVASQPMRPIVSSEQASAEAIQSILDEQAEQRRRSAEMWARSRSVMFEPSPQWATAAEPVLPGLDLDGRGFEGVGFRFLGCFLGLPAIDAADVDTDAYDPDLTNIRRTGIVSLVRCGARD